jgi:flagellar motor component MotA
MDSSMAAAWPRPSAKTGAHFQASSDFSIGTPLTESTPMLVIIGYIVAFGCIFGTYVLHGGNVSVIIKALPFEMITIGGGAIGAFIVCNQPKVLKATAKAIPGVMKSSRYTKARFMELMALLYEILQKARKEGLMSIEGDVEAPSCWPTTMWWSS